MKTYRDQRGIYVLILLVLAAPWATAQTMSVEASSYYCLHDSNVVPGATNVYLESNLGGISSPQAYFPDAAEEFKKRGMTKLKGSDAATFEKPDDSSALGWRSTLYATSGTWALAAFYENAISSFTPKIPSLLDAEQEFRTAIRVNPHLEQALDGLLETYYGRSEGFMLIGNDYMAKAFSYKFNRPPEPTATKSIREVEVEYLDAALTAYTMGFREFFKLFNTDFTGYDNYLHPELGFNADNLFFRKTYLKNGQRIAFESIRGATNAVGASTKAIGADGKPVLPVQGAPPVELTIRIKTKSAEGPADLAAKAFKEDREFAQAKQLSTLNAPVKFLLPVLTSITPLDPGTAFTVSFSIEATTPVKEIQALIEFDNEQISPPVDATGIKLNSVKFSLANYVKPGEVFNGSTLYGNQIMVHAKAATAVQGSNVRFGDLTFTVNTGATPGTNFNIYVTGSAGSLISGYKDVALIYRLAAARGRAALEKARRLYIYGDEDSAEAAETFLGDEIKEVGGWVQHLEQILDESATPQELENADLLQQARSQVVALLSSLEGFCGFVKSGLNPYGYASDYVPFYNSPDDTRTSDAFGAIRELIGTSNSDGYYAMALSKEMVALKTKSEFQDTRDRIRNELFTINEQAEARLVQICGRIDTATGSASTDPSDPIDYEMKTSMGSFVCEVGQAVLELQKAYKVADQAQADIDILQKEIKDREVNLKKKIELREDRITALEEYSYMQQGVDEAIGNVMAWQARLTGATQAASTILAASDAKGYALGSVWAAGSAALVQAANGIVQGELEKEKGRLQAKKTRLSYEERIKITKIDDAIAEIEETQQIEEMINQMVLKNITAEMAAIDIQIALGRLNALIAERDEKLAARGRQLANLGEMSFADPSFRLYQFQAMVDASTSLDFLKSWLYLMTRALQYKWALPLDAAIDISKQFPTLKNNRVRIGDIARIQVVGDTTDDQVLPLADLMTAYDYIKVLTIFNDSAPIFLGLSQTNEMSDETARFSLREDFLSIARIEETAAENTRIRDAFRAWLTAPERLISDPNDERGRVGDMVIEFNTLWHLDGYDLPIDERPWNHFGLRT